MSVDASNDSRTPLHEAIRAAALEAYGSLLSEPLAEKAAASFADEANAMIEAMLADHAQTLRDRIEAQLTGGVASGKGGKRKVAAKPAPNGAPAAATLPVANGDASKPDAPPAEAAEPEPKPIKAAETKAAKAKPRKRGRAGRS